MRKNRFNNFWLRSAPWLALLILALEMGGSSARAAQLILHLKNGDRLTGTLSEENTNRVVLTTPYLGKVEVPLGEIARRESLPEPPPAAVSAPAPAAPATPQPLPVEPKKAKNTKGPMSPGNPEAMTIAATPSHWKHDLRLGLNLRYSAKDSQEFWAGYKSTYGKQPLRHIFDLNFRHGRTEGILSANSLAGSGKTEYQLSPKTYWFGLAGGGYDEVRRIDAQFEIGPGLGVELLKLTNFVWKTEAGFSFREQYRADKTHETDYSLRVAEIFGWRMWGKLMADAKIEFYPDLGEIGEYRFRLESTLRYPVSERLSLNLDAINLYDTQPAQLVEKNDFQVRSSVGVSF